MKYDIVSKLVSTVNSINVFEMIMKTIDIDNYWSIQRDGWIPKKQKYLRITIQ